MIIAAMSDSEMGKIAMAFLLISCTIPYNVRFMSSLPRLDLIPISQRLAMLTKVVPGLFSMVDMATGDI